MLVVSRLGFGVRVISSGWRVVWLRLWVESRRILGDDRLCRRKMLILLFREEVGGDVRGVFVLIHSEIST